MAIAPSAGRRAIRWLKFKCHIWAQQDWHFCFVFVFVFLMSWPRAEFWMSSLLEPNWSGGICVWREWDRDRDRGRDRQKQREGRTDGLFETCMEWRCEEYSSTVHAGGAILAGYFPSFPVLAISSQQSFHRPVKLGVCWHRQRIELDTGNRKSLHLHLLQLNNA